MPYSVTLDLANTDLVPFHPQEYLGQGLRLGWVDDHHFTELCVLHKGQGMARHVRSGITLTPGQVFDALDAGWYVTMVKLSVLPHHDYEVVSVSPLRSAEDVKALELLLEDDGEGNHEEAMQRIGAMWTAGFVEALNSHFGRH